PAVFDPHVAADGPAQLGQPLRERRDAFQSSLIAVARAHEHADPPHALPLLRARRERPRGRAAEQRDEVAALHVYAHSITSSATASRVGGMVRRSALAVSRLTMKSNLVGCSTGMSAGLVPRRILST